MKRMLRLICLLVLPVMIFAACSREAPPRVEEAPAMPDIVLPSVSGETVALSQYKGRVIMLNFWATWCPPCQMEIPDFIDLQKELGPEGLTIIGVSVDEDRISYVKAYSEERKINYPVLYAGDDMEAVADAVGGIRGIPTTFLIDRDGRVVEKVVGVAEKKAWAEAVKSLL
jgi:cytochrome c biogenesis protein CcmG/thiol:disulfide interchange protein DsbE